MRGVSHRQILILPPLPVYQFSHNLQSCCILFVLFHFFLIVGYLRIKSLQFIHFLSLSCCHCIPPNALSDHIVTPLVCLVIFFMKTFKLELSSGTQHVSLFGAIKRYALGEDILCFTERLGSRWMKDFLCSRNPARGAAALRCYERGPCRKNRKGRKEPHCLSWKEGAAVHAVIAGCCLRLGFILILSVFSFVICGV